MNTAVRCGRDNALLCQNGMKYNENAEFMMKSVTLSLLRSAATAFDFGGPDGECLRRDPASAGENSCPFGTASCWGVPAPNPAE